MKHLVHFTSFDGAAHSLEQTEFVEKTHLSKIDESCGALSGENYVIKVTNLEYYRLLDLQRYLLSIR